MILATKSFTPRGYVTFEGPKWAKSSKKHEIKNIIWTYNTGINWKYLTGNVFMYFEIKIILEICVHIDVITLRFNATVMKVNKVKLQLP